MDFYMPLRKLLTASVLAILLAASATDARAGDTIQVFLLIGQSNMVGHGRVEQGVGGVDGALGSLRYLAINDTEHYGHLLADPTHPATSPWAERQDVWIWHNNDGGEHGNLTVGYGRSDINIGPEFGFGHAVGDRIDDQVLIIKACWGGKSLGNDFLPPSAADYPVPSEEGDTGYYYQQALGTYRHVIENIDTLFPAYDGEEIQLAGIGWCQGYNDRFNDFSPSYERNLVHLINDLRSDLGVENLPFVIAETGNDGEPAEGTTAAAVMDAQEAVTDFDRYPAFRGNVAFVETTGFWRERDVSPTGGGHHWYGNGESYYLIGNGMGQAMGELLHAPQ